MYFFHLKFLNLFNTVEKKNALKQFLKKSVTKFSITIIIIITTIITIVLFFFLVMYNGVDNIYIILY